MIKFGVIQQQSAIVFAVKSFRKHMIFYVLLTFFFLVSSFLIGGLIEYSGLIRNLLVYQSLAFLVPILSFALQLIGPLLFFAANIAVFQNETPSAGKIIDMLYPHFLVLVAEYIIVTLLYGILVFFGTLVFILPGIYALVKYQFCTYLIIDKKYDPLKAMSQSAKMTDKNMWQLFIFDITIGAFNVIGMFFLGLGLLISIPISLLAFVYVYKYLLGELPTSQNPPRAYIETMP